jgi:hypothetical protein
MVGAVHRHRRWLEGITPTANNGPAENRTGRQDLDTIIKTKSSHGGNPDIRHLDHVTIVGHKCCGMR